ncbi:oxygen-independent coproporphyrinogen III oxidase [Magnetospirillum sp. UT-4]|uniref:oxygen-independent coproporphyrinogen III oxidase n=1 Tax=Magnetospirillum sp. UT-4 TaxID=2681467 RepID=UPI00137E0021|nr:oxygen-independent coproporphyrinogen III oxidase [Magnetospirillum sp. UT-4]CAA7618451.1 putative Oxygen-independent coproporphyrinogen-III oxidase [Magnetospirillum sp. UT-4]
MALADILDDVNLLKKYDVDAFDYVEYPHKSAWSSKVGHADLARSLATLLKTRPQAPVLLYLHIPFCEQLCLFCTCHRQITHDYAKATRYLEYLSGEIDVLRRVCEQAGAMPNITDVFFGGGSPTFFKEPEFIALKEKLATIVDFSKVREMAIEIDPRRVDVERLKFYRRQGATRLSFGVQDFDPDVQVAIDRIQPPELMENLLTPEIRGLYPSVNFDLLCGLPRQTKATIGRTIDRVIGMRPDRITLTYVHYSPKFHQHQVRMNKDGLIPDFYERKVIFVEAMGRLLEAGYIRTGFEHLAWPTDSVAQAFLAGKADYNPLGAYTGDYADTIGLGRSAYSCIGDDYYQSTYEADEYEAAIGRGEFPVFRGCTASPDDLLRRQLIKTLRTYFIIDIPALEASFGIRFAEYFAPEIATLREFAEDGLLTLDGEALRLTENGRHFSSLVCSVFDKYTAAPRFNAGIRPAFRAAG